jgi:hypothetical protein
MQDASGLWNFAPKGFHDVKTGNNGSCSPSQLCTARAGWDGPTGWGSPSGTGSLGVYGPTADLKIQETKTAGTVGSHSLSLTFTITNLGPSAASGVILTNEVFASTLISATGPGCSTYGPPGTATVTCGFGTMAKGAVAHVTINYIGGSKGSFQSGTGISAGSPVDVKQANNSVSITTTFSK